MNTDRATRLAEIGIREEKIEYVEDKIEETTRHVFDEYDVALENPDRVVEIMQDTIFATVIEHGKEIEDDTIEERFEYVADDFEQPESSQAINNIVFTLGSSTAQHDIPSEMLTLGNAIIASNYEKA